MWKNDICTITLCSVSCKILFIYSNFKIFSGFLFSCKMVTKSPKKRVLKPRPIQHTSNLRVRIQKLDETVYNRLIGIHGVSNESWNYFDVGNASLTHAYSDLFKPKMMHRATIGSPILGFSFSSLYLYCFLKSMRTKVKIH